MGNDRMSTSDAVYAGSAAAGKWFRRSSLIGLVLVCSWMPDSGYRGANATCPFPIGARMVWAQNVPLENQLSAGTTGFLRTVSKRFRQLRKVILNATARWRIWVAGASVFVILAIVTPVLDAALLNVWRRNGARAFASALGAAVVVYVRLILDRRTPGIGKALLLFAVVYGAAGADLMPDRGGLVWGFSDDILLIVIASRCFMRMCSDELIVMHATKVEESRAARRG